MPSIPHCRERLPWFAAAMLLLLLLGFGCAPADRTDAPVDTGLPAPGVPAADERWILAADPAGDLVRTSDTEASLRARFGDANIASDTIWVGEGLFEIGTVIFPGDSALRVAVQWDDGGHPELVRISDRAGWAWRLHPGAGIGTTLEELEQLNASPFEMYGFGWDYAGTVAGWRGGRLDERWGDRAIVRLRRSVADERLTGQVLGERVYPSDHPAMRGLRPVVHEVLVRPR